MRKKREQRGEQLRDKLAPIRDVFDAWVTTLSKSFIPFDNVTINEQLVAFRGRCSFRMYMKSKPAKCGLKLWALCDSATAYVLNLQVYTGKVGNRRRTRVNGFQMMLFYNILDISAVNSFVVWKHLNPDWNNGKNHQRRLFLKELGTSLVQQPKDRLEITGLSLDLKPIIKKCLRNMAALEKTTGDDSTVDDETELVGGEGSDHDEEERPPKPARKRGRCGECKREKDLKVRTHCDRCDSFACSLYSIVLCNEHTKLRVNSEIFFILNLFTISEYTVNIN